MNKILNHKKKVIVILLLVWYYFCLPTTLFNQPTTTVVTASNGELLGAVIATDGQWRFPTTKKVPYKIKQAILQFEDAYFYQHFGFNPVSITKALLKNIKAKKVVGGGSTVTQQVIRLSRKGKKRSYTEKVKELIFATRLEFRTSKENILKMYVSNAPFGGNVVGLEMASWRYFGLEPQNLSWAESATLAVLPNAPSLIYPGKNQQILLQKRNRLLNKMYQNKIIDSITYGLSLDEPLPEKPYRLPTKATHLVQEITKKHKGKLVRTSIDIHLQEKVNKLVERHYNTQKQNGVFNMAVLVLDVETRKVLAYIGNSPTDKIHQKDVNNIHSGRSTGSVLKPILYAQMLQSGDLLPTQLVPDIPIEIAGYSPKNYNEKYDGAVAANEALTRSLNIPAVKMLQRYGLEKFRNDLKNYKIKHINKKADYYGLSLILGGAEASLWDLCKTFAGIAGTVTHFEELKHNYYSNEFVNPSFLKEEKVFFGDVAKEESILDAGSSFITLNTLTNVNRPEIDQAWKYYDSASKIAWKTGTSFGNRDAWAIGTTAKYVVGVWIGNSDGEGRASLTGLGAAAPLLFNVFDILPKSNWFLEPYEDLVAMEICNKSGFLALPICPKTRKRVQKNSDKAKPCRYHKVINLDKKKQFRVHSNCETVTNISKESWFLLPPLMAHYYKNKHANYKPLPPFRKNCRIIENQKMDFIYPSSKTTKISLTIGFKGEINPVIFKITHPNTDAVVFWYLDNVFKKSTQDFHEIELIPSIGKHILTVIDEDGNELKKRIEIIE